MGHSRDDLRCPRRADDLRELHAQHHGNAAARYLTDSTSRRKPDFAAARTWIAYDRGDSLNAELLRRAGGRSAFLFDQARPSINPYSPIAVTTAAR